MSKEDVLLDGNMAALAVVDTHGMELWSEQKRNQFAGTFKERTDVARYLLLKTGDKLVETARNRRFISDKHVPVIYGRKDGVTCATDYTCFKEADPQREQYGAYYKPFTMVGGRSISELDEISQGRANDILKNLPPIRTAVNIIDPAIAKKMDRRDFLLKKGQEVMDKLLEFTEEINLADYDDMKVSAFRAMMKERDKRRRTLVEELEEIGAEGTMLEDQINKALYQGIPGLSDAVIDVAKQHFERAVAFDQMNRRVAERVIFGDSEAALEILKGFEKDEAHISETVKAGFVEALEKLKLIGQKRLAGKKKS